MQNRNYTKLALIGTSCAGKSECLTSILGDKGREAADMDNFLYTSHEQSAEAMLAWILNSQKSIVAVSVHRKGLIQMVNLKKESKDDRFDCVRFVYLFCERCKLKKRLYSSGRPQDNINNTLDGYDELDIVFKDLTDDLIDTTRLCKSIVAEKVQEIASQVGVLITDERGPH